MKQGGREEGDEGRTTEVMLDVIVRSLESMPSVHVYYLQSLHVHVYRQHSELCEQVARIGVKRCMYVYI